MSDTIIVHPGELTEHPANSNTHDRRNLEELAESRRLFGQYKNIVVWEPPEIMTVEVNGNEYTLKPGIKYVIAGNGFHQASLLRGDDSIEVKDYSRLSYDEAVLLMETDNASPLGGRIDPDRMRLNLERVRGLTADNERMSRMLERARELRGANGTQQKVVEDEPPIDKAAELQEKWQVQPGDLWQLGEHRLACGDCREPETWQRLLDGRKVNGVFTSPPYAEQRKQQYGGVPASEYVEWWEAVQSNVRGNLTGDGSFFVNIKPHAEDGERSLYVIDLVLYMARDWRWSFVDEFCWLRSGVPKMVKYRFKNAFEPVYQFSATKKGFKFRPDDVKHFSKSVPVPGGPGVGETNWASKQGHKPSYGDTASDLQGHSSWIFGGQEFEPGLAYPSNVLKGFSNDSTRGHEAAFPIQLPAFFIRAYSDPGDLWLDPFIGSGTTIMAAENEGRIGYGIELLEKYCAVTLERYHQLTNRQPERLT